MRFLDEIRDPKPRLKPGFTYFRLIVFMVGALTLAIIALNVAEGSYPDREGECTSKGIDSEGLNEGTCTEEGHTLVVVDRGSALKIETLEAKLLAIRYRSVGVGSKPSRAPNTRVITVRLRVKNLTDSPAAVRKGQIVLNADRPRIEDSGLEESRESSAHLTGKGPIPPGGTASGTVSFRVPASAELPVRTEGNLEVLNFGHSVGAEYTNAVFDAVERGVFRTYH